MTLTITDTTMTSDQTPHVARQTGGPHREWEVSWLPGQSLDRNSAVTAMILADLAGEPDLHGGHQLWPAVESWSAELCVSEADAVTRASQPPPSAARQPEPPGRQPERGAAD